ncbi:hypothetical protein Cgig2_002900 [Carnegiea gigantea]|uniref:Amidophosphoribosyltransferase n=1 Tax=Carnegiea gigantea TaxID=171969 RepID=A0A9Q1KNP7_9CARY|nr:hypothetical protein Cgig2_002900 [Carnegiea gigantea]
MASINLSSSASLFLHENPFISPPNPPTPHIFFLPKTPLKPSPAFASNSQPHKLPFKFPSKNPITDLLSTKKNDPNDQVSDSDKPREECGVVGISNDPESSRLCSLSLHALQHRGQDAAGIVSVDNSSQFQSITGLGLVSEVFKEGRFEQLQGNSAIGHVRYSTSGAASTIKNVQPFVSRTKFGQIAVAHNGNFVNYKSLRKTLEEDGAIFSATSDTEVVLHLIGKSKANTLLLAIIDACVELKGAYSMVFLCNDKLIAIRDPFGFRPLVMGRRRNGVVVFASESCALDLIEAKLDRDVFPGEVVVVDGDNKIMSMCLLDHHPQPKQCIFEHIYFSQPNSLVFGTSVYEFRYSIGEMLAVESPVGCDVVVPVPDSGVVAALGYAAKAGVPFQQGLIRSHYVGRTFIEKSQAWFIIKSLLFLKELISNRMNVGEIREFVGADSLAFLSFDGLQKIAGSNASSYCYGCFTAKYPIDPKDQEM